MFLFGFVRKIVLFIFIASIIGVFLLSKFSVKDYIASLQKTWNKTTAANFTIPEDAIPLVDTLKQKVAFTYEVNSDKVEVKNFQPMIWTNSCMDIRKATSSCENVIIPGFKVTVKVVDVELTYHIDKSGKILAEN
jgi:hypothetical protein